MVATFGDVDDAQLLEWCKSTADNYLWAHSKCNASKGGDVLIKYDDKDKKFIVDDVNESLATSDKSLEIITPRDWKERGSQVSVIAHGCGKDLFDTLTKEGIITDWREPNVIRMAPIPLYNSFKDIYRFGEILKSAIQ